MAETSTNSPVFQIQRVYLKELSLEQPNSPTILLQQKQPELEMKLNIDTQSIADGTYEICVTATVQTKIDDKTVFLVEAKQAGIFEIRNLQPEQLSAVLGVTCPQVVYPYLRSNVADVIQRAGFPAVNLTEINFQALYQQQQQQKAAEAQTATASPTPNESSAEENKGSGKTLSKKGTKSTA